MCVGGGVRVECVCGGVWGFEGGVCVWEGVKVCMCGGCEGVYMCVLDSCAKCLGNEAGHITNNIIIAPSNSLPPSPPPPPL